MTTHKAIALTIAFFLGCGGIAVVAGSILNMLCKGVEDHPSEEQEKDKP